MGKFKESKIYVFIPDAEVTQIIINLSVSRDKSTMPSKLSDGGTGPLYRLVEFEEPAPNDVAPYQWYSIDEVVAAWEAL